MTSCSPTSGSTAAPSRTSPAPPAPPSRWDSSHLGLTIGVKVGFTDAHGYEESSTSDVTARVGERAHKFWTATLTATGSSGSAVVSIVGYPAPLFPGSSLTDATVTYGPNTYSVESIQLTGSDETSLSVRFSQAPTEGEVDTWILDVNGKEYFPSQSTTPAASDPDRTFLWENSGLSWSDGEVISLALKVLNQPAQGRPSISGTRKFGETLTADTSGITDPDGIPDDAVFTYQWVFFDVVVVRDIAGATGPSYTITRDREGDVLGVRVGFADSRGFDESVTSGPVVSPQSGDLWVAALTVGRNAALDQNGFGEDFAGGALTDATFSHAGKDYTFNSISHDSNGRLRLMLEPELTELDANLLDFYVRVHPYHFSNRSSSESSLNLNDSGQALIVWADAALIWAQGDVIRLALKAANQPAGGTPVIKGALRVDDVLTADTSGITDGNGIPEDVVFSYQWFDGTGQGHPRRHRRPPPTGLLPPGPDHRGQGRFHRRRGLRGVLAVRRHGAGGGAGPQVLDGHPHGDPVVRLGSANSGIPRPVLPGQLSNRRHRNLRTEHLLG